MKYLVLSILFCFIIKTDFAQNKKDFEWNGYGQFRLYKINSDSQGFIVRRTKFWIDGKVSNLSAFRYKVMGIFNNIQTTQFNLLDAYAEYIFANGHVRIGRQIPEFSLQRLQPDWKIPVVERASVINALIPGAQSSARDIGIQIHLKLTDDLWQISFGIFNGNGANIKIHKSSNFLYSFRTAVKLEFVKRYFLQIGISLMNRKTEKSELSKIFGNKNFYTGDDSRFGFDVFLNLNNIEIQGEYIKANFNGEKASGYYAYINYNFASKDQLIVETEKFDDLNKSTNDDLWLKLGFNHLFASHDFKIMVSGGTQFNNNYSLSTQLQIFFN